MTVVGNYGHSSWHALVGHRNLAFTDDVRLERGEDGAGGQSRVHGELRIERVHPEVIVMKLARRRLGSGVTGDVEVCAGLTCSLNVGRILENLCCREALRQSSSVCRNSVDEPLQKRGLVAIVRILIFERDRDLLRIAM
jgi:hypothetical protein